MIINKNYCKICKDKDICDKSPSRCLELTRKEIERRKEKNEGN